VKRAIRAEYKAAFGPQVFSRQSLHAYQLTGVKLSGNQYRGTFTSQIAARNHNAGAGMPDYSGTYRRVGSKYALSIDPASR